MKKTMAIVLCLVMLTVFAMPGYAELQRGSKGEDVVVLQERLIELGFLDDPTHYAYHENIRGALWIGHTAKSGIYALGKILNGEVNPSGKTVDTYVRNFKKDPTWHNFGNNLMKDGNRYTLNGSK